MPAEYSNREQVSDSSDLSSFTSYDLFVGACGSDERAYRCLGVLGRKSLLRHTILFAYRERETGLLEDDPYRDYLSVVKSWKTLPCSTQDNNCRMREFIESVKAITNLQSGYRYISIY